LRQVGHLGADLPQLDLGENEIVGLDDMCFDSSEREHVGFFHVKRLNESMLIARVKEAFLTAPRTGCTGESH